MSAQPERTVSSVFHRRPGDEYPVFVRGEGSYLWDDQGKRYLDCSSGMAWSASLGQGRPDIAETLADQAGQLTYIHNAWASTDRQEEFAARLTSLAPEGVNRAMFTSGGSESNELGLRIARQFHLSGGDPSRWKVITLEHSYHGATVGALSMTGKINVNEMVTTDYEPYLIKFPRIPAPFQYRGQFSRLEPAEAGLRAAEMLADRIEAEGPETVAAFNVEPVMGNAGMIVAPPGYLQRIREICDQYGVLFILDEVMTGAGRTGTFLCSEQFDVVPDLIMMAKSLSGGYAGLGAVLVHDRVADAIMAAGRQLDHVHTYSGHPISCAVGLKVLDILEDEGLIEQSRERGEYLRNLLYERLGDLPCFGDVRGLGLANALEYVADRETRAAYPQESNVGLSIWEGMLERGFIVPTYRYLGSDLLGDFSLICPPFVIAEAEIEEAVSALRATIEEQMPAW